VMRRSQDWWDRYFLDIAEEVSKASKDPSTKVGAVIVRPDRTVASLGYNGLPICPAEVRTRSRKRPPSASTARAPDRY
jgi:dCMP deaminase